MREYGVDLHIIMPWNSIVV